MTVLHCKYKIGLQCHKELPNMSSPPSHVFVQVAKLIWEKESHEVHVQNEDERTDSIVAVILLAASFLLLLINKSPTRKWSTDGRNRRLMW